MEVEELMDWWNVIKDVHKKK